MGTTGDVDYLSREMRIHCGLCLSLIGILSKAFNDWLNRITGARYLLVDIFIM